MDLLDSNSILALLNTKVAAQIKRIDIYPSLPSTNTYLLQHANEGAAMGCVCLAEHQTAGRGRNGHIWVSPPGGNVYLSILWYYHLSPMALGGLSLACGVAVVRVLLGLGINGLTLKWPNDVLCNKRKLAGLLLEVRRGSLGTSQVVVGLGLNVCMPTQDTLEIEQPWTALDQVSNGVSYTRNSLVAMILNELVAALDQFGTDGLETFIPVWSQYDALKDTRIRLLAGTQQLEGEYAGIAKDGALLLRTNGMLTSCYGGEVQECRLVL